MTVQSFDAVLTEADLDAAAASKQDLPDPAPASVSERENLTGQLIDGRYQIDYVLGVGSMGIVYGARHAAVGKLVAVKALRAHLASDAEAIQRFNAEATAATSIGNQHIVETFDFGRLPDGTAYLVMEVPRRALARRVYRGLGSVAHRAHHEQSASRSPNAERRAPGRHRASRSEAR